MENNNSFGLGAAGVAIALGLTFGLMALGSELKYAATRYACITQHMSAQDCATWETLWEKLTD